MLSSDTTVQDKLSLFYLYHADLLSQGKLCISGTNVSFQSGESQAEQG